uniref:Probable WRKY transcription factor 41 n=1 Tax=Nicotiana tabacum TaxID=4097 RepID=A0A1S3XIH3_TOBAC|nr:PREDICTED: probable WRKY transcription factor 41 [Nicotiana tabacum]
MENYGADNNGELNRIISELTQGKDLVHQLQLQLNAPYSSSSSSPETTRDFLLHNIQSKFDKALSLLQYSTGDTSNSLLPHSNSVPIPYFGRSESPPSFTASPPHSEDSDRDLEPKDPATRKRKSNTPRWTKQVQICPGVPVEGTLDDGFNWRKYGQKDILGAKYPRLRVGAVETVSYRNVGTTDPCEDITGVHFDMSKVVWLQNKFKEPMKIPQYLK